jgi:multiple sugar transport system substrate-binding protein
MPDAALDVGRPAVRPFCVELEVVVRRGLACVAIAAMVCACTAPANPTPSPLRVAMADDWASAPVVGEIIEEFQRDHPQVRVEVQASPFSQVPDVIASSLEVDRPYDLAHWHAFAAASAGLAQPLDELWEAHGLEPGDYLDGALEDVTWDGRRYGVPLDTNALVLLVDETALEEAGRDAEDLRSVEGFLDVSRDLVAETEAEHAISVSASSWIAYGWIRAFGGTLVEDVGSPDPRFTFDDPATVAALELMVTLLDEELAPSPFAPDLAMEAVQAFAQGSMAMHATGSWDLPLTARTGNGLDPEDVAVLPLPRRAGDTSTVLGGSSLFVPSDAAHPELAFELALRLTEDDVALRLAEEEGRLPARERVFDAPLFSESPDLAAFVAQLPDAEVMPLIAYPEVATAFREGLESCLAGRQSASEAMDEVQAFAEEWLARGGG